MCSVYMANSVYLQIIMYRYWPANASNSCIQLILPIDFIVKKIWDYLIKTMFKGFFLRFGVKFWFIQTIVQFLWFSDKYSYYIYFYLLILGLIVIK